MPYPGFNNASTSTSNYAPPPGPPPGMNGYNAPPYEDGRLPGYGVDFPAKDMGNDTDKKGGDPFMDAQETGLEGRKSSETDPSHHV